MWREKTRQDITRTKVGNQNTGVQIFRSQISFIQKAQKNKSKKGEMSQSLKGKQQEVRYSGRKGSPKIRKVINSVFPFFKNWASARWGEGKVATFVWFLQVPPTRVRIALFNGSLPGPAAAWHVCSLACSLSVAEGRADQTWAPEREPSRIRAPDSGCPVLTPWPIL